MSDIFISYAREDRRIAEQLAAALASQGWSVWWDRDIPIGQRFPQVVEAVLAEARAVLVIWSAHSVNSDWVLAEAGEGLARNCLLPVSIDRSRPPLVFRQLETADLSNWDGGLSAPIIRKLLSNIDNLLEPPLTWNTTPVPHQGRTHRNKRSRPLVRSAVRSIPLILLGVLLMIGMVALSNSLGSLGGREEPEADTRGRSVEPAQPPIEEQVSLQDQSMRDGSTETDQGPPLVVTLSFTEKCWLEARVDKEAKGITRNFVAGESLVLEAQEQVVLDLIGNTAGVEVSVNGKQFDINATHGRTARNVVIHLPDES